MQVSQYVLPQGLNMLMTSKTADTQGIVALANLIVWTELPERSLLAHVTAPNLMTEQQHSNKLTM